MAGPVRSERVVFHSEPDFDVSYDQMDLGAGRVMTFVHLDVFYFDKSTWKRIQWAFDHYRPTLPPIIFAQPAVDSPLFEKFVSRFGFQLLNDCHCDDGLNRRIFVHYRIPDGFTAD